LGCNTRNCNEVWYFAYGSNLYIPPMFARVGEWKTSKKALLKGWRLIFNVDSKRWGGGAANITKTNHENDIVYGAIYLLSHQKLEVLTKYEGVCPRDVKVEPEGEEIEAETYIFNQDKPCLKPSPAYIQTIIDGLIQHGYGKDVVKTINKLTETSQ